MLKLGLLNSGQRELRAKYLVLESSLPQLPTLFSLMIMHVCNENLELTSPSDKFQDTTIKIM